MFFLSFSVEISCEKKFKGSNQIRRSSIMGPPPGDPSPAPWDCSCFVVANRIGPMATESLLLTALPNGFRDAVSFLGV